MLEHGNRGRLVVHKHAALAVGENLAAQNNLIALRVNAVFFEDRLGAMGGLKDAGHHGLVGSMAHHFGGGFAAHQERQRVHEDGFAGTGFTGEQVQSRPEDSNGVIDDCVVFRAKFDEHS